LTQSFKVTFNFEQKYPSIYATLQVIQTNIFSEEGMMEVVLVCSVHKASMTVHELLECYSVVEEEQYDEDPRNVKIPETEGGQVV